MYQRIDGNTWRHVWIAGDLHGCHQRLLNELRDRHFDPYKDLLICVGDLIDRGPDSLHCLKLLKRSWFKTVRGNHEQMAIDALNAGDMTLWSLNGGAWFNIIAHADYPSDHYAWQKPVDKESVLWRRERLSEHLAGKGDAISGADHFWFGHTPLKHRVDATNQHYIDTGAVFGGEMTLVQVQ